MSSEPSPSKTITRRSGRARARPSPMDEAPPMKPVQVTERSPGARARQAGAGVMVGTQMASPRAAMMIFSTSSGFMAMSARLQADQHGGGAPPLAAQAVVLGNEVDVVGSLHERMRHAKGVEKGFAVANHRVERIPGGLVLHAAGEPDHVAHGIGDIRTTPTTCVDGSTW